MLVDRILTRTRVRRACAGYMHTYHSFDVVGLEHVPSRGPALILGNHSSYLDLPALIAFDPCDGFTMLAAAGLFRIPILGSVLRQYSAIPVHRKKRDPRALGGVFSALKAGKMVAVSVEGGRSWDGRLGDVHPVLAMVAASVDVPLIPAAIVGAHRAMPRGSRFPRRLPVRLIIGEPFSVPRRPKPDVAAAIIRARIAALLPDDQKPLT